MRGKQALCRDLHERANSYLDFKTEFGHLEGDTIVGEKHKSAVITLVERCSKAIITLKTNGRKVCDIEASINQWLSQVPSHLFKSITFDCGKEFSNWKSISNAHDIDIFFADPGCPGQRLLAGRAAALLYLKKPEGPHGLHLRDCIKFLGYHYYPRLIKPVPLASLLFFFSCEISSIPLAYQIKGPSSMKI